MYLAYSLLLTLGLLVLAPYFLYQALAHGKYLAGLRQRLGSLDDVALTSRPVIWLHCVSVGETQAARPLVERLLKEFPDYAIVVSTITNTGQNLARSVFASTADAVIYFPFDWRWSVRRALKRIQPAMVLIMETELWPNFLSECQSQNIPVALVNGRISRQSFRRYRVVRFFLTDVLAKLNLAVMQSPGDAERIADLGLAEEKLFTSGNLKFDGDAVSTNDAATAALQNRFDFHSTKPLILAASTHDPEEKIIIDSFRELRKTTSARLMIAPRHPERFQDVAKVIESSTLSWSRRTDEPTAGDSEAEVILLDTIGELPAVYSLAKVVFVGGSIIDRGGHNVLEPAAAGACVMTGSHTHNFQAVVELLNDDEAIIQLPPLDTQTAASTLALELSKLLASSQLCEELGARAKAIVQKNRGAADRTVEIIKPLLNHSANVAIRQGSPLAVNPSGS